MGGSKDTEKQSQALTQQQIAQGNEQNALGREFLDYSRQRLQRSDILQKPLIDFYGGIAQGNMGNRLTAASPMLGQIEDTTKQAQANIWNNVAPGAARDYALAQTEMNKSRDISGTLNNVYQTALQQLGALGAGQASLALQETGAGFTGLAQSGNSYQAGQAGYSNIMTAQNQRKAATMGTIGSLVGAAGTAAGGYLGNPNVFKKA